LTHYLAANIQDRKLETPFNTGRIWRVVPENVKLSKVQLSEKPAELVKSLESPEGWVRDTAQRLLVEKKDPSVVPDLVALAARGKAWQSRIHAMWTLEGMGMLPPEVVSAGIKDKEPRVRTTAVQVAGRTQLTELVSLKGDENVLVQSALAAQWSTYPETQELLVELARRACAVESWRC
jgi:hypothetical protein